MDIRPAELEKATNAISKCIPELIANSTIGIVAAKAPYIELLGTGTLLAVAEHRFIVTAAHVIKGVSERTIGIMNSSKGNFVSLSGHWFLSSAVNDEHHNDPYDVAIYELSAQECSRLSAVEFVRVGDVEFNSDLSSGFFLISGFPRIWSTSIDEVEETMRAKLLQYGTCALESVTGLQNYDPQLHILLRASPEELFDHTGKKTKFRIMRSDYPARMPDDLLGVSGCSVWKIGDLNNSIESWRKESCRLVGIETGIYSKSCAIKVTRWNAVATLLYEAVPAIRPVIRMYENQLT